MAISIEESVKLVLGALCEVERDERGEAWLSGAQLQKATNLSPAEINDAVTFLNESGLVEWRRYLGTAPFVFGHVTITPRGRFEFQHMTTVEQAEPQRQQVLGLQLPITPVGSPYGFTYEDWEIVQTAKERRDELRVVLGLQLESRYYNTDQLEKNVEGMFKRAVEEYNQKTNTHHVTLSFKTLGAGYGTHLFNEIARDIISADIAVFDTSDQNPNVMLETGVALTWGIRVLPIKKEGCPKPPSDISGQTWADYRDSGREFFPSNQKHHRKLVRMVEYVARKKER